MSETLLKVQGLKTVLHGSGAPVRAVDGIDLEIRRGETFALVGESGSGKSMTALSIMRLLPETGRIAAGKVGLDGADLLALPEAAMRLVRGRRVAMIFQETATSLNPVLTVGYQIREVLERHTPLKGAALDARVTELIESVGISDAARRATEYPFQLSGGLKQRAMIAMALAAGPDMLIADEPTTALDVTIQAQILELLRGLQAKTGMAMLLITHDLGIVSQMAQRVAVMYAGHLVEVADRERFFSAPQHPYSRKLFAALRIGNTDGIEQLHRALLGGGSAQPRVTLEHLGNLVTDRHHRVEARTGLLEDHRDALASDVTHGDLRQRYQVDPFEQHLP